eukprot:8598997-Alexandrium_andersonii.AAC.1
MTTTTKTTAGRGLRTSGPFRLAVRVCLTANRPADLSGGDPQGLTLPPPTHRHCFHGSCP